MRNIAILIFIGLPISASPVAVAQLCGPSIIHHRHIPDQISALKFKDMTADLEFQENGTPYTSLYVSVKFLNVRDEPDFGTISGLAFAGETLFAFAKKGDWVAVSRNRYATGSDSFWVHINFLSPHWRHKYTSSDDLLKICPVDKMAYTMDGSEPNMRCESVKHFLRWDRHSVGRPYKVALGEWLVSNGKRKELDRVISNCF